MLLKISYVSTAFGCIFALFILGIGDFFNIPKIIVCANYGLVISFLGIVGMFINMLKELFTDNK